MNPKRFLTCSISLVILLLAMVGCAATNSTQNAHEIDMVRAQSRSYEGPVLLAEVSVTHDIDMVRAQSRSYEGSVLVASAPAAHDIDMVRAQSRSYEGPVMLAAAPAAHDIDTVRAQSRGYEGPVLLAAAPAVHDIDIMRAQSRSYEGPVMLAAAPAPHEIDILRAQSVRYVRSSQVGAVLDSHDIDMVRAQLRAPESSVIASTASEVNIAKSGGVLDLIISFNPDKQCMVKGVQSTYTGWLDYDLVVNDQANDAYYLAIYTLDEGKTLADVQAIPEANVDLPAFVNLLAMNFVQAGNLSHNLVHIASGPLYVSCYVVSQGVPVRIADLGPIPGTE